MTRSKILFTGFKKINPRDNNSSCVLLEDLPNTRCFLFTNDFAVIDKEIDTIFEEHWDKIVMFGQKPVIKRLSVDKCAKFSDEILWSNYDFIGLKSILTENKIDFKWSENPGHSYCNYAYFRLLKKIQGSQSNTKVVFIHIPYVKNFVSYDAFRNLLLEVETF